jgi:hypothetical protein
MATSLEAKTSSTLPSSLIFYSEFWIQIRGSDGPHSRLPNIHFSLEGARVVEDQKPKITTTTLK